MGYNIIIGEYTPPDRKNEDSRPWAESVHLEDAPAFGEPTDRTNERWPSYTGWADFLSETGLGFLSPNTCSFERRVDCPPLMDEHPGFMPVLPIHLAVIIEAQEAYRVKVGLDKLPGSGTTQVPDPSSGAFIDVLEPNHHLYDQNLARLAWLRYWVEWALKNCKKPVCCNS